MPNLPSAKKALRSSKRKAKANQRIKSRVKTAFKKLQAESTDENLRLAQSAVDKAVKKNIFHKNKAARLKSRMAKIVQQANSENSSQ